MPVATLHPDALDANRRGELSDVQLRNFGAQSRDGAGVSSSSAGFLVAGAVLFGFFASPTSSVILRALITIGCVAIAAFLVVRSITGGDALTRDLRRVQVQSVEGAIGKRRLGGRLTTYFLQVGDRRFKVGRATYDAAPDAGFVRLYFLPRSRKIVNLERLPNAPLPSEVTVQTVVQSLSAAIGAHGQRQRNEARAGMASIGDALKANLPQPTAAPPPDARDPRPLGEAIVGTWNNALTTVTFSADGRVTMTPHMLGAKRDGRWSVDGTGRLRADITGGHETADAWVAGNQLTITVEGEGLTFTREGGA